jgi:glutamate-1-semialdehyde aminotransferase/spore coat polysaccharide biosynthesis protein SpsF (cytidylyltransferase family)
MKKVAIIQARMGASRFPGKVLEFLNKKPVLHWVVDAVLLIPTIDQIVVATSDTEIDQPIADWCSKNQIAVFRGSESDVLSRFYVAAKEHNADVVVRITADCPLLDPNIVGQVLYLVVSGEVDYASNVSPATWPDGLDCEAFTIAALEEAHHKAGRQSDREHVTPYIRNNQYKFKIANVPAAMLGLQKHRWTIDTKEDLEFVEKLVKETKVNATTYDYLETLKHNSKLVQPAYIRNEGFDKSLQNETVECTNFQNSKILLNRALKTIPLGSQTFSKSYIQYPENTSPMFLTHGEGSHVWDVDGNEYIDLVSGLLPNVLGYNDADVNYAISIQLQKGISFSLSTDLEIQLAEKLCDIIPCAQKVRFAKNGTDVTTAAIRLARAFTRRDKVILCGYHGWQDWSIGTTTRNKGVPKAVSELSVAVPYNDLNRIEELLKSEEFSCVIMEACNSSVPHDGYLQGIKNLCEQYGSLFIFDEVITGFRFALGGAQEYFGVTPHLSCFGKAMGNGMPISAIVGRYDVMREMEDIFFSGTFGGETLSLAASLATIEKIEKNNVIKYLWSYGQQLDDSVKQLIAKYDLEKSINLCGYAPWKIFQVLDHTKAKAFEIKTLFIQEMIKRGILINSSLNINFAHGALEKYKILKAIEDVFGIMSECLQNGKIKQYLKSSTIKPLFKVR